MLNNVLLKIGITKKITRARMDKFLARHRDSRSLVLDLGCGPNAPYRKYFPNRVGFDIVSGPGVDIVGDAHRLPFEDNKFDLILCTDVLDHLHSPHIAISEMRRVLKPGGRLISITRFVFPLHDVPGDYYRFTKYGLKHLFKEWEIVEFQEEANTMETIAVILQRIGYQCDVLYFKPFKLAFLLAARALMPLSFVLTKQFGDISQRSKETNIMASGYYMVCRKLPR